MKKIISIVLACIMMLVPFSLIACDSETQTPKPEKTETAQQPQTPEKPQTPTQPEEPEQPQEPAEPEQPEEPTPLLVSGMNAKQLFEKFYAEFTEVLQFDLSITSRTVQEGETVTERMDLKMNESAVYVHMEADDTPITIWCVDDVLYADMDGIKYKASGMGLDDILGEGALDELLAELDGEMPEDYLAKFGEAEILAEGDLYYFSVTFTAAEAEAMELGEVGFTETYYVDATGTVKKLVEVKEGEEMTIVLNSYGVPVTITAPEDPDSFLEAPTEGPGDQDPDVYGIYEALCDTLAGATSYSLDYYIDDELYMSHKTDGEGQYVLVCETDPDYEVWEVDGKVYKRFVGEDATETDGEEDTYVICARMLAENNLRVVSSAIPGDRMLDLELAEGEDGELILTFMVEYENEDSYYTITFDAEMTSVHIHVYSLMYEETELVIEYFFDNINDAELTVEVPSV
jgi:hypothetical protein